VLNIRQNLLVNCPIFLQMDVPVKAFVTGTLNIHSDTAVPKVFRLVALSLWRNRPVYASSPCSEHPVKDQRSTLAFPRTCCSRTWREKVWVPPSSICMPRDPVTVLLRSEDLLFPLGDDLVRRYKLWIPRQDWRNTPSILSRQPSGATASQH